jgi:hypothetical protein
MKGLTAHTLAPALVQHGASAHTDGTIKIGDE